MREIKIFILLISAIIVLSLYWVGIPLAFRALGFDGIEITLIFLLSIFGSYVNIPIIEIKKKVRKRIRYFGITYLFHQRRSTRIAINVGGAVIPIGVSIYEIIRIFIGKDLITGISSIVGILILTIISKKISRPIKNVGIAIPGLLPPFIAATIAILLPGNPAIIAYLSGTLGTLIGADILNLNKIKKLRARYASIGGAGTFDGIFLSGIIAVLLVS